MRRTAKHERGEAAREEQARAPRDPLDLHFQRMTDYPLLTHDGEIALARRIERVDLAISRLLLGSSSGRRELVELAAALRARRVRVEEVERNPASVGGATGSAPSDELANRLEQAVEQASSRAPSSLTRPRARGLRLHPRAVRAIENRLACREATDAADDDARETARELGHLRRRTEAATAEFVQANLRIVVTFARRYRGMPLVDLVQEGNLGLLRAVDKYDYRRGLRFSTYAAWWIRHALQRALADQGRMIRLPVHLTGAMQRVRRAQERMARETGRDPTFEELAARTGLSIAHVRRALEVVAQPVSLDATVSNDRDAAELGDFVADASATAVDEIVAQRELRAETREILATLPEREAEVIRLRYGVGGTSPVRTLEEVGARMSLSRERARQLERSALEKLRAASERRRLRVHLER